MSPTQPHPEDTSPPSSPVHSHNEWDPLEEVIVGTALGACFPSWDTVNRHTVPPGDWARIAAAVGGPGRPYPPELIYAAERAADGLVELLVREGVTVRRPSPAAFHTPFSTPAWSVECGFCAANPRDPFIVFGDELLETPMPDRSRAFEAWAYRDLFNEYLRAGARWTSAPKPRLLDALYRQDTQPHTSPPVFALTEVEPVFDAADIVRCGRDVFIQRSQVTNAMGVLWLRRHLGPGYRVHEVFNRSSEAIHIDTTFMPLAPGKAIYSPEYLDLERLPAALKGWELRPAPEPVPTIHDPLGIVSRWGSLNVLMLDPHRPIVEARQRPLIEMLRAWGFDPLPCAFEAWLPFAGSFHCATLDVRRRGTLQSYC